MTTESFGGNPGGPPPIDLPAGAPTGQGMASSTLAVAYQGEGMDLFMVMVKNMFFTLITLGIYTPWARAARRTYLWQQVDIGGHRLAFTGTGKELFFGYLKVLAGYLLFFGMPKAVGHFSQTSGLVLQAIGGLAVLVILPFAVYWSRRYILGRTRWRGIRFGLIGDAGEFAKLWIVGVILTGITLGIYGPVFINRVYGHLTRNTTYGTARFSYDGRDGEAFKIALKGFLLSIVTFGIYYFWYVAEMRRFRLAHTHFDGATGALNVTGGLLWKLALINVFGIVFSLGIALPWIMTYSLYTLLGRVSFVGPIDFAQITQQARSGDAAGDALGGALGVELGL